MNLPNDINVKIAGHEITHALLKHPATLDFSQIHCKNFIGDKRCLMNTEDISMIEKFFDEIYLGFCQPCTYAIKEKVKDPL